jgi:hypothetical protein
MTNRVRIEVLQVTLLSLETDWSNHVFKKCKDIDHLVAVLRLVIDPHSESGSRSPDRPPENSAELAV